MVKSLLVKGNKKLGDEVYIFSLPAIVTCSPTDWCLHGRGGEPACYALRNRFLWENVQKGFEDRLKASKQKDFDERMIAEIHRREARYFRFHVSGDFYSEEYVKKIIEIAQACPDILFRTTTRRRDLIEVIQELASLPNFIVRESLDTERTRPEMGLPFAALSSLPIVGESNSYHCLDDCPRCGYHCWENDVNMDFDEH